MTLEPTAVEKLRDILAEENNPALCGSSVSPV
jgi:hypothetical protein